MNYKLLIPSGASEIYLSMPHGNILCKNEQIFPESFLTKSYPNLFIPIPEVKSNEVITSNPMPEVKEAVVKKKSPGRPKQIFKKG